MKSKTRSGSAKKRQPRKATVKSHVQDAELVEMRREQIVAAAVELFSTQGYDRTTILEIARKAQISVGLIYQYAQTKEDVLFLTLLSVLHSYKEEIPAVEPEDGPLDSLWKALSAYGRVIDRRRATAVLAYRSTQSLPPAQRRTIMGLETETNDLLAKRIQACVREGLFRELNVELAVYQIVMHAHAWALKHWRLAQLTSLDGYLKVGFDSFVRAWAVPQGMAVYEKFLKTRDK